MVRMELVDGKATANARESALKRRPPPHPPENRFDL